MRLVSGVAGLGGRVHGAVACVVGGWSRGGRIRSARGTSLAGVLVGAVGCHLPLPARIRLPHFVAFVAVTIFFVALIVLLVVAVVVGLAFALLVVAVAAVAAAAAAALIVLVALVLAAVFALLFGSAWGYVRSALACAY